MSKCCKERAEATRHRIKQVQARYDYIMDKDNPYYRIFGTESERLLDANWQVKVLNRLKKIQINNLCDCTQNKNNE
jgi:hypothetical protein